MNLLILHEGNFHFTPAQLLEMEEKVPGVHITYIPEGTVTLEQVQKADAICGAPPVQMLAQAPNLKWLHRTSAGVEQYNSLDLYANRNVVLTNSSGVYGVGLSEHVLAMTLAMTRNIVGYVKNQQQGLWEQLPEAIELFESTVAVLGLGDLGLETAKRFKALGCTVLGVRRNINQKPECVDELFDLHALNEVLPRADVVVVCLPLTPQTTGIFNKDTFAVMRRNAILVNIGRGKMIVVEDLLKALKEGRLSAACLDANDPEPLPPDHPLWRCDNVLITPHVGSHSERDHQRRFDIFIGLLERFAQGRRMYNQVDFFTGY